MAEIYYIPSKNISVFPAGFRGSKYDLSAKLTSEQNLTNIIRVNKTKKFNNFVLVEGSNVVLGISGYRFIVKQDQLGNYKYAGIKTEDFTDTTNVEGSGAGSIGKMLINIPRLEPLTSENNKSPAGDHNLDIDENFTGLILFNDSPSSADIEKLGLTDYIEIVRDDEGNIIEKGFRLSTDSVINSVLTLPEGNKEISIDTEFTTNKLNVNDEAIIKKLNVNNQATIKSSETNYNEFTLDGDGIELLTDTNKAVQINNISFKKVIENAESTESVDEITFNKVTNIKTKSPNPDIEPDKLIVKINPSDINKKIEINTDLYLKSNLILEDSIGEDNKITKHLFIGNFGSTDQNEALQTASENGYYFDGSGNLIHKNTNPDNYKNDTFSIKDNDGNNTFSVNYESGNINTPGGTIDAKSVHASTFYAGSDRRIKENIKDTEIAGLDIINNISVKEYNLIADEEKKNTIGCIAQELREVLPDNLQSIVKGVEEKETLAIDNDKLIYILIKAVQELSKEIEELKR